ncbi:hypothetical protein NQ318_021313 [Aromia moschata]|uniref:Uncharacterized protein n=1 Tax=Aromia moschata TaxID=1265417 RepID=A0AAV8ZCR0_9CUCU|nr:hypothetical protein NQ318_021313 [Aromia moschata]
MSQLNEKINIPQNILHRKVEKKSITFENLDDIALLLFRICEAISTTSIIWSMLSDNYINNKN